MKVIPFFYKNNDDLCSNTYIVIDNYNNCIVIDPSVDYPGIVQYIIKNNLTLKAVFLIHTHFDHMRGLKRLIYEFNIPFFVSKEDKPGLTNPKYNCSNMFDEKVVINYLPEIMVDNQTFNLLSETMVAIATPYHTIGSMCLYFPDSNLLFSGDSLFNKHVGRSDLITSEPKMMKDSLKKIFSLKKETKVYPGHGLFTTIEQEIITNDYLK